MSRTVRRGARYHMGRKSAKWYNNYLTETDLLILRKRPVPREKNLFRWVWLEGHWIEKREPYEYKSLFNDKIYTGYHTTRRYFEPDDTKPIPEGFAREWGGKTKHRVQVFYPGMDRDSNEEYHDWLRAHKEVHRNESCVRCRRKTVRLTKRIYAQMERAYNHAYTRKLVNDYFANYEDEVMPSASTYPNRRFYANPHYTGGTYGDI